ncbi:GNAT family N-acetyltransferase [Ferruginibacter sp. HRS2-29]|uniref:GNAT family N-acetyltransferase n=1 Tax=Ferruginibacter sp. HRS2-29 TaxID=2487334 RepID=UPI0020CCAA20|nr:GNAT family N-acetyltransferase [Ferruginibacter sp. HRS2-29]MCP9749363.1 GNAT family N-acetyltransferase [Ferruginibacter sp. HRS2-29]
MFFRNAGIPDIDIIRNLAHTIWPVSYKGIITDEQIGYMLELIYSKAALIKQMDELKHQFVLVYNDDENATGFASYSPKVNDDTGTFRLNKLYLLPDQQGKGTGKALLQHVKDAVKKLGGKSLELNVNKENPAIQFYKRNDFTITKTEVLDIGHGFVMDDYIMSSTV